MSAHGFTSEASTRNGLRCLSEQGIIGADPPDHWRADLTDRLFAAELFAKVCHQSKHFINETHIGLAVPHEDTDLCAGFNAMTISAQQ